MQEHPADSRDYIVAFELRSADDCPPGFALPASLSGFDTGLFLPRGDRDWFGRPLYPPRILVLKSGALSIVSHPSADEPPRRFALDAIAAVESGHMLLKGWLRFTGSGFDYTVPYNTRGFPPVFRFMNRFRSELLQAGEPGEIAGEKPAGAFDIKFANALGGELDPTETVLMSAFQPPEEAPPRSWFLPRHRRLAGDLLAVTGKRLLWITDRTRGFHSPYGSIASYAPLAAVGGIDSQSSRGRRSLQVALRGGSEWQIPIAPSSLWDGRRLADEFAKTIEVQKRRNEACRTELHR